MYRILTVVLVLLVSSACNNQTLSADEVVTRALNLMKAAPHYTVKGSSSTSAGSTKYTILYQAPDRYRVTMVDGPDVIVIGDNAWGYDSDKGWIKLAPPNPHPRELSLPFKPGELAGFRHGVQKGNYDTYILEGAIDFVVFIDRTSGQLDEFLVVDDSGTLDHLYDFKTPVVVNAP